MLEGSALAALDRHVPEGPTNIDVTRSVLEREGSSTLTDLEELPNDGGDKPEPNSSGVAFKSCDGLVVVAGGSWRGCQI